MQSQPLRRGGPAQPAEAFAFEAPLENEEAVLDAILAAMARGALPDGTWERLDAAAQRDERTSELAFAFEGTSHGKRLKTVSPAITAEFLFQAGRFFGDVFGDEVAALTLLERALAAAPSHAGAFGKLEELLTKMGALKKLAELHAAAAQHRPRAEQPRHLRHAADLLAQAGGADDRVIELLQLALRLEPGDEATRAKLEAQCLKANRLRDVVRLNEQALVAEPPPDEATRAKLLSRLVELYADKLHEPERAMPHVENLLAIDPANDQGRKVAQKLVVIKGLAGRAAAALANAHEALGAPEDVARYLMIELESTRGPKRAALLARLGRLRAERLGDDVGAFEALEQALAIDAGEDDLRAAYAALARKLGRYADASKTLGRVHGVAKSPAVKAMAAAQLGEMLLRGGDPKRAKAALAPVLVAEEAPPEAVLGAARALAEIYGSDRDARGLADVLERMALLEPEPERRQAADERLAVLAAELGDRARAVAAYERLLSTSARAQALAALAPLYEAGGDPEKHARLLEEQAKDLADPQEARARMMRAAEVRAKGTTGVEEAIATCRAIVDRFGPARDVHALLLPLLEAQRRWADLSRALVDEAALTSGTDHAQVMVRLGTLRVQRLADGAGAIDAFTEALTFDPSDKTARLMLEKLAAHGDQRLPAARVLEPFYRRQGANGPLLKVLELRGALEPEIDDRLAALREAARLADAAEAGRATDVVGRALADAVAHQRPLAEWLERLDAASVAATDAKRRAAILGAAIGEREVTTEELKALAMRAADAHSSAGEIPAAIALFQRALSFDPHSTELLSRIDDLLRDQGSPAERVALYRAALARGGTATKRKELLHRIGAIERHDLADPAAAIVTFRAALEDDAEDADAQVALGELYAQSARWTDLCDLLDARLARAEGDAARTLRATLAGVAAEHGDHARARAQCEKLLEEADLSPEQLDAVAHAADAMGNARLERGVLLRRVEAAEEPGVQIAWLDRLGELEDQRLSDPRAAAEAWKRAAALAAAGGDDEQSRRLYERAHEAAPDDRDVAWRLVELNERAGLWGALPPLYAALGVHAKDDAEKADLWLRGARVSAERLGDSSGAAAHAASALELMPERADALALLEEISVRSGQLDVFERSVDQALQRVGGEAGAEARARLLLSRARVLAGDPRRADDGARAYRAILEDRGVDEASRGAALAAFEALIAGGAQSDARRVDRRWLLEWRAENAPEADRPVRLLDWARQEETTFGDHGRALALFRRVLELDPESDEALSAAARLALAAGDVDAALAALGARRGRADGAARASIDLEIAGVLLSRTSRRPEALEALRSVLSETPNDAAARTLAMQLLEDEGTRAEAVRMLDQTCDAADDAATRVDILTRLLEAPADGGLADARRRWFERLCDLHVERGAQPAAFDTASRAVRELPDVPTLWDRADAAARALARPDDMAALYEEVLSRPLTQEQARTLGERAVRFCEEWFEEPSRVMRVLERVLTLDPRADWAFDRLKLLLDAAERWDELFALYDRALTHADDRARVTLLEDAAQTAKDFADRPDRAIQYLEALAPLKPQDAKLTNALERLYERQGRHRELVALLSARLPALDGEQSHKTRARVASLWLEGLRDPAAAFDAIEPALDAAAPSTNGAAAQVWSLLEQILRASPPDARRSSMPPRRSSAPPESKRPRKSKPPQAPPSVRQRVAGRLREHYAQLGDDAQLVRMLLVELEAVKASSERMRRHLQIADTHEKLGDAASALEHVGHAVVLDPKDESKRTKLAALAESTGQLQRFAELLSTAAGASEDAALRILLTMQAATVRAERTADVTGAIALLSAVLATPELRDDDLLAAGRRLEALLEGAVRDEERLDVLERIAGVEPDPAARRDVLGRAARLAGRLGKQERAIASWEKRIATAEDDREALDGLVGLLEAVGRLDRLADVLSLRARAASEDGARRADRVRVASLYSDALGRPADAISAWRQVEELFGPAEDARLALASLFRQTRDWRELAALLERSASQTVDAALRADLLRQLGDVDRQELGAAAAAVAMYGRALESDPHNEGSRAGLLALADDPDLRAGAVSALLAALRAADDWRAILDLASRRLLAAATDAERLAVLRETAQIFEHRAGDTGMAFEAARSALVIAPGDPGVEAEAVRLAEAAQAWGGLVVAYREAIDGAARGDGALVARLRTNAGSALESRLGDVAGALEAYLQVVKETVDEGVGCAALRVAGILGRWDVAAGVVVDVARAEGEASPRLLAAYEQAAEASGRWAAATRALEGAVASAGLASPAARDIEATVAVWHRDRLADPDAAESATARALSHDPSSAALLSRLAELQRRHRGRSLVDTLLRLSSAIGSDPALLREAAEVARESAGDPVLTRGILTELLELARARWPQGEAAACADHAEWAIESLARLHEDAGDAKALADVLTLGDSLPFSDAVRRGMRRRAARVALEQLHDDERATALYLALFEADPEDREAAERLAAIFVAGGRTRALLELRQRQIAVASDVAARMGLRLEASALMFELGERDRAAEVLVEGLREDPRHEGAVEALARVYAENDRARDQIELLVDQAQRAQDTGDVPRAANLWGRAAGLAEERLGDVAAAEAHHARVAALEPRPGSLDALGRLATARGDHAVAAQWLERLLETADVDRRETATLRLADAWVAAGEPSRATERLARALVEAPAAQPLRDKLAALYRDHGSWSKLAELTADAAAHAPDKPARMARLCEAARLFADACGQPQLAVPLLEQAVDLAPDDQAASLALADALARSARFDDARNMLRTMIDAFGARRPKERAPVHYQMARLELAMGNRARALVELDMAARVDPQNPDILRALAELARDDGQHQRAEKSYRALLVVLRRREDAGEFHNVARSEVLLELSGIAGRQGEADRAKEILESALEAAADGDFEQERLEAALRARGDFATLARVLEARLARLGDTPAAAKSLGELAQLFAEQLGKVEEGLSARLRALALDPRSDAGHAAALALARVADGVARYVADVSALADRFEGAGDPVLARALLARAGAAAEQDLHDDARATVFYERAVSLGLRDSGTLRALDGALERLGDVAKRARALEMRIEIDTQTGGRRSATDAMYRLASIRLASRDTLDQGVDMMREALDLDPRLDVAGEALRAAVALDAAHPGVLALYEHVGRQPGHERVLIDALRARAELPGADAETVREAVEIAVRLGERAQADSLLERVVEREKAGAQGGAPSRLAWALDALANVRSAAGDLRSAVELKTSAARISEPDVARRLTLEVAQIAADRLEDLALAAEAYEGLRRADPADREAWEPLAAVYRRQGNSAKLAELLAAVVDFVDDTGLRARLRLERVRALESTGLSDVEAAPLLREIVDDDARQVEAALMLAGILERSGATGELKDLLARQIDAAKDRDDAQSIVSLSLRLGLLLEPGEPMQARNVYYAALEWRPQSAELLDALLRLLDDASDAGERADLRERRLSLEGGAAAEPMALALAADRAQLGDDAGAERALEVGYRAHPASALLRDRLETSLRARGDLAKLAELYVLDAGARPSVVERIARLHEAAAIRANELQDFHGAAAALKLARDAAAGESSEVSAALLRGHVEMLLEAGDLGGAIAELSGAVELCAKDDPNRGDLLAARADLRSRAGDDAGALEDLEASFAVGQAGHAGALAAQLDRMCVLASGRGDAAALRTMRLRQAQVLPFAGETDGARAVLVDLLAREPKDASALRALADLEGGRERWDAASAALKRLVGLEEGEATVATALRLADVCERARRPADARGALERARLLAPLDRNVTRTLERLYEQTGAWRELADLVLQDAKASGDVADRFPLLLRVGSLMLEQAGDPAAGVDALEEAHALRPGDPECVALLADAFILSGRVSDAAALLDQVLGPHKGRRVREMAPLYFRLARVARTAENPADEVRALFQALDCDAQNGAVCSDVALRAIEIEQIELASRALRAITLLKSPGPMSKAVAYQHMGEIARKQGDGKRALMLLHRALTEDPGLEAARTLVAAIEKGG